jgi:threonine aldolase
VGVIAAAGIVALDEMVDRLADDHANARLLGEGLSKIPGLTIDPALVQTNIVFLKTNGIDGEQLAARLKERGVLSSGSPQRLRMVTHYGIEPDDVEYTVDVVREVVASLA